jgi:hypothetical protein
MLHVAQTFKYNEWGASADMAVGIMAAEFGFFKETTESLQDSLNLCKTDAEKFCHVGIFG